MATPSDNSYVQHFICTQDIYDSYKANGKINPAAFYLIYEGEGENRKFVALYLGEQLLGLPADKSNFYISIGGPNSRRNHYIGYGWIIPKIANAIYTIRYIDNDYNIGTATLTPVFWDSGVYTSLGPYHGAQLVDQTDYYELFPTDGTGVRFSDNTTESWIDGSLLEISKV